MAKRTTSADDDRPKTYAVDDQEIRKKALELAIGCTQDGAMLIPLASKIEDYIRNGMAKS